MVWNKWMGLGGIRFLLYLSKAKMLRSSRSRSSRCSCSSHGEKEAVTITHCPDAITRELAEENTHIILGWFLWNLFATMERRSTLRVLFH